MSEEDNGPFSFDNWLERLGGSVMNDPNSRYNRVERAREVVQEVCEEHKFSSELTSFLVLIREHDRLMDFAKPSGGGIAEGQEDAYKQALIGIVEQLNRMVEK